MLANDVSELDGGHRRAPVAARRRSAGDVAVRRQRPEHRQGRAGRVRPPSRSCCSRRPPTTRSRRPQSPRNARWRHGDRRGDPDGAAPAHRAPAPERQAAARRDRADLRRRLERRRQPARSRPARRLREHIPIYTVALGTPNGTVTDQARVADGDRARAAEPAGSSRRSRRPPAGAPSPLPTSPSVKRRLRPPRRASSATSRSNTRSPRASPAAGWCCCCSAACCRCAGSAGSSRPR